jgi:hypothetical protein
MIRPVGSWLLLICAAFVTLSPAAMAQLLPGERAASVTEIPGVIAAGASWELVWAGPARRRSMLRAGY